MAELILCDGRQREVLLQEWRETEPFRVSMPDHEFVIGEGQEFLIAVTG